MENNWKKNRGLVCHGRSCRILGLALLMLLLIGLTGCSIAKDNSTVKAEVQNETVVLLHGLGRSKVAMWLLAWRLQDAGFDVQRVGYPSIDVTLDEVLEDVSVQIDEILKDQSKKVHFVGHSFGGLLVRAYLGKARPASLGRVVLIGSPNKGTPIADRFQTNSLVKRLSPIALALGTENSEFLVSLPVPDYPVGVIAGKIDSCFASSLIEGESDGLVPVDSTKVVNMTDFIVVETGHSAMRYNDEVAMQTIYFLQQGNFSRL